MAFRAREVLELPESTVAAIRDRVSRCAYSTFYEFPSLRLNQINWPIEVYTAAAEVTGETHLLAHDTRLQLSRFARALTKRCRLGSSRSPGPAIASTTSRISRAPA